MSRIATFIDGGYLDKVLKNEFYTTSIDYNKLSEYIHTTINPDRSYLRTYYYHCLPYKSTPPTRDESTRFAARQNFYDAISRLPRFEVKLGHLARRRDLNGRYRYEHLDEPGAGFDR